MSDSISLHYLASSNFFLNIGMVELLLFYMPAFLCSGIGTLKMVLYSIVL